jgi:FKBP-type peptidyl-prolyl cis-trans isomerase 2
MHDFSLGDFVSLPAAPEWGVGQVQSVIGHRVTVNFDHAGKQLINTDKVRLVHVANETDHRTLFD